MIRDTSTDRNVVLVVEDDCGLNSLICRQLESAGYSTISAFTGNEALKLLGADSIPVMLLDYQLPDMTGDAIVKAIQAADISTLFVIMTGHGDERLAVAMMKLGASDYFVKETHFLDALPMVVNRLFSDAARDKKLRDAARFRGLTSTILSVLNKPYDHSNNNNIGEILRCIKTVLAVDALGIRLKSGDDYPYSEYNGFSTDFIESEWQLSRHDEHHTLIRDDSGKPVLDCLCGIVLSGRTDPSQPYFTTAGSFWTNSVTAAKTCLTDEHMRTRIRNRCGTAGYESVALIPLRYGSEIIGLLQLNDKRKNMFNEDTIHYLEETADIIGIALARRRMEDELKESKLVFDTFMEFSPIYVSFKDENMRSLNLSRNYENMLKKPMQELLGKSMEELFPSEQSKAMMEDDKRVLQSNAPVEVVQDFAGRTYRTIKFPIKFEHKPPMLAGFTIDITEQQASGRALIQADKLKSLGVLSSGIAHEINQPLAAIALGVDYLLMKKRSGSLTMEFVGEKLNDILQYIERMRGIIDEVRTFSREQGNERLDERFSVNDVVRGALQLVTAQYRVHDIRLMTRLAADIPPVRGNRYKIEQVLLNMLSNARDAVEERGRTKSGFHPKNIAVMTGIRDGAVAISVIDNGTGMSEDVRKNMFSPFFSTKEPGHGTGLGMSISYGLVKAMNGDILFNSKPGYYTIFRILLPADAAACEADVGAAAGEK